MVPAPGPSACRPRTRGDRPTARRSGRGAPSSSPHPRGSPLVSSSPAAGCCVVPAPAGIALRRGVRPGPARRSSPHPRGSPRAGASCCCSSAVVPAPAGIAQRGGRGRRGCMRRPRTRGDRPTCATWRRPTRQSSPHPRGSPSPAGAQGVAQFVVPAPAGIARLPPAIDPGGTSRPRTRGDRPPWASTPLPAGGSSPHPRGSPSLVYGDLRVRHVVPAPAGIAPGCGDRRLLPPVVPAPAGIARRAPGQSRSVAGRPRTRGDRPDHVTSVSSWRPSSPHPRGPPGCPLRPWAMAVRRCGR